METLLTVIVVDMCVGCGGMVDPVVGGVWCGENIGWPCCNSLAWRGGLNAVDDFKRW